MSKAFKNNMKPGVPKVAGFKAPTPGLVAAKPSYQKAPTHQQQTIQGDLGKTKLPR